MTLVYVKHYGTFEDGLNTRALHEVLNDFASHRYQECGYANGPRCCMARSDIMRRSQLPLGTQEPAKPKRLGVQVTETVDALPPVGHSARVEAAAKPAEGAMPRWYS